MPRSTTSTDDSDTTDSPFFDWDGVTMLYMRGWLRQLPKVLRRMDTRFRTYYESGYIMYKQWCSQT